MLTTLFDPSGRKKDIIFRPEDFTRLQSCTILLWAKDEPISHDEVSKLESDIEVIITDRWRYGDVKRFPKLRAILEVSGGHPSPDALDYETCFAHSIRVLSCAPAFGPAVAEMGLTLALNAARKVVWNHEAFRKGDAHWNHKDPGDTFTL